MKWLNELLKQTFTKSIKAYILWRSALSWTFYFKDFWNAPYTPVSGQCDVQSCIWFAQPSQFLIHIRPWIYYYYYHYCGDHFGFYDWPSVLFFLRSSLHISTNHSLTQTFSFKKSIHYDVTSQWCVDTLVCSTWLVSTYFCWFKFQLYALWLFDYY